MESINQQTNYINIPQKPKDNYSNNYSNYSLNFSTKEIKKLRNSWLNKDIPKKNRFSYSNCDNTRSQSESISKLFSSEFFWNEVYEEIIKGYPEFNEILPPIEHQTVQFASIVLSAMENLENLNLIKPFLQNLGRTHIRVFNTELDYFQKMGDSLYHALQKFIIDGECLGLWMKLYCFLANSMTVAGTGVYIFNEKHASTHQPLYISTLQLKQVKASKKKMSDIDDDAEPMNFLPTNSHPKNYSDSHIHKSKTISFISNNLNKSNKNSKMLLPPKVKRKKASNWSTNNHATSFSNDYDDFLSKASDNPLTKVNNKHFTSIALMDLSIPLSPMSPLSAMSINTESTGTTFVAHREYVSVGGEVKYISSTSLTNSTSLDRDTTTGNNTSDYKYYGEFDKTYTKGATRLKTQKGFCRKVLSKTFGNTSSNP